MEFNALLFPSPKTKISLEVLLNGRMAYIPKLKRISEDSQIPMSPRHSRPSDMMALYPPHCVKAMKNITFEHQKESSIIFSHRSSLKHSHQQVRSEISLSQISTPQKSSCPTYSELDESQPGFTHSTPQSPTSKSLTKKTASSASFSKNANLYLNSNDENPLKSSTFPSITVLSTLENSDFTSPESPKLCPCKKEKTHQKSCSCSNTENVESSPSFLNTLFSGFSNSSKKQPINTTKNKMPSSMLVEKTASSKTNLSVKSEINASHRVSLSCNQLQQPGMILTSPSTPVNPIESIQANGSTRYSILSQDKTSINAQKINNNQQQKLSASESQRRFTDSQLHDKDFLGYDVNTMLPIGFIPVLYLESPNQSANVLIYFHGNGDDVFSSFPLLNHLRTSLEVHVIAVEYPGYGQYKTTQTCSADMIEEDADYVLDFVTKHLGFQMKNILLLGRSLGTGPATYLASKNKVGALILISAFTSIRGVVSEFAGIFKYIVKERFDNLGNIKKVTSPTFLLHGKSDRLISYKQSLILKDSCNSLCEVLTPKDMNHREFDYRNDLSQPLLSFLSKSKFPLYEKTLKKNVLPEGVTFHPTFQSQAWMA